MAAPSDQSRLCLDLRCDQSNPFVVGIDEFAAELTLPSDLGIQSLSFVPSDFIAVDGRRLESWRGIREIRLGHQEVFRSADGVKRLGGAWKGEAPEFVRLCWKDSGDN